VDGCVGAEFTLDFEIDRILAFSLRTKCYYVQSLATVVLKTTCRNQNVFFLHVWGLLMCD